MYSLIELDELRRRRKEIRKTIAAAERVASSATRKQELDIEEFVRLVVRGACRLKRISDRKEKKAIIHSLFEMLVVKMTASSASNCGRNSEPYRKMEVHREAN